jgi:hypothetical protein
LFVCLFVYDMFVNFVSFFLSLQGRYFHLPSICVSGLDEIFLRFFPGKIIRH